MLQTNNTGVRSQCLSHTRSCPRSRRVYPPCPHCLGSRLFCREQSEAGPGLSSQVQATQVMRCLASANAETYRLPATRLSGCKTRTPSQADVDRPDPQEVLVSKEACLQFYR